MSAPVILAGPGDMLARPAGPRRAYPVISRFSEANPRGRRSLLPSDPALWVTTTASTGAFTAMRTDGNVVVYGKSKRALWATHT
jgi:hypothetical protein